MQCSGIKVVAFDCDGVLFDSTKANQAYYNQILNQFNLPAMSAEQFGFVHMATVDEALAYLFETPEAFEAAKKYSLQMTYMPFIQHMTMEPYLRQLLSWLKPDYKTAIATNRTNTMNRVLEEHHLQGCFDKVVTAADVAHAKPYPDQLLSLLDYFEIKPQQMVYVGDSKVDAEAADQANVFFVAYDNPELKAQKHIQNLGQIIDLLVINDFKVENRD